MTLKLRYNLMSPYIRKVVVMIAETAPRSPPKTA